MEHYGIISLIPVAVVIITAILTRRSIEPLILGGVVGYIIVSPTTFVTSWIDSLTAVIGEVAWYLLLFVITGIFILLLEKSGGAMGFASLSAKFAKTRKSSLIMTWILGIGIFLDDYLNCLGVSIAMRQITDKHKTPREYLAYIVNSTGATVCLLVPISTWAVFMISQLELVGVTKNGSGLGAYVAALPYMFYAWLAVIIVPLFIMKIVPLFGPMKKAVSRAENEGKVHPESYYSSDKKEDLSKDVASSNAWNFVLPILVLSAITLVTGDILLGMFGGIATCALLYLPQKLMKPTQFLDCIPEGLKSMGSVMITMCGSFVLNAVNKELGLTPFVLETVTPLISGPFFALITFIVLSALSFATASPWAMATVSFPIIMPMAMAVDANLFLVAGALISGTAFGSHACFYGDAAILTCAACEIEPYDYARTSIPLVMLPFALACIAYLAVGFIAM